MNEQALRGYLDEHLTGARTVTRLVERRVRSGRGPAWMGAFHTQLREERAVVERIAAALDAQPTLPTAAAGQVAQLATRGALRLVSLANASLRDLLEYELMLVGVQGKACLWRALRLLEGHPALAGAELDRLERWAAEQTERLEQLRLEAAGRLFGGVPRQPVTDAAGRP